MDPDLIILVFLLILLDDGRIRILTSGKAQKLADPDPEHWFNRTEFC